MANLGALKYYGRHEQWSILLHCVNSRLKFLQRCVNIGSGSDALRIFDMTITRAVATIMGMREDMSNEILQGIHNFRGLPLALSGGTMARLGWIPERVCAVRSSRLRVRIYGGIHESEVVQNLMNQMWENDLPVENIRRRVDSEPRRDMDPITVGLGGHPLADIPEEDISRDWVIPGAPNCEDNYISCKRKARETRMHSYLITHMDNIKMLADSPKEYKQRLAAQCLSGSCLYSGQMLRWVPTDPYHTVPDPNMVYLLRLRFGVRPVGAMSNIWICPHNDGAVDVNEDPYHGWCCKQWRRTSILRHDAIRDHLVDMLRRLPEITIPRHEPVVGGVEGLEDGARGDALVIVGNSKEYVLDVSVVCVSSQTCIDRSSHKIPGVGAKEREARKKRKYSVAVRQHGTLQNGRVSDRKFVPFIIESGGRMGPAAIGFVKEVLGQVYNDEATRVVTMRRIFQFLMIKFMSRQLYYLRRYFEYLKSRVDRRAMALMEFSDQ